MNKVVSFFVAKTYLISAKDQSTNTRNAPALSDKLSLTATGQLQKQIAFKEGAPVMITSNHSKKKLICSKNTLI